MMFNDKIRQLREALQIPQRKMAAALDIDTATYCKFEKGERKVQRKMLPIIANLLQADETELLTLWLADKVVYEIADENIAFDVLKVAEEQVKYLSQKDLQ